VPHTVLDMSLGGLESKTVTFKLRDLAMGTHIVQVASFSEGLAVQSWIVDNPDLVQLVMRYSGSDSLFSAGSVPIYQAAKLSEGNVAIALFAIGAISALLALLAITSVFSKEIREARRRLGILKTIGAPRSAIRKLVFPQALESSLAGATIGIAFGIVIADSISKSDLLVLFGHRFHLDLDTNLLVLLLLGAVAISVSSALFSAMMAVRETTIRSIRRLEEEPGEPIDVDAAIADE
jgi:ABC-type antimicrobial peptide transport system permease subunit